MYQIAPLFGVIIFAERSVVAGLAIKMVGFGGGAPGFIVVLAHTRKAAGRPDIAPVINGRFQWGKGPANRAKQRGVDI